MSSTNLAEWRPAALAFDRMAEDYDLQFTQSAIGRAQRNAVWRIAAHLFVARGHILELNCGTGEDAIFLARYGNRVTACDASKRMILRAKRRHLLESPHSPIRFEVLPTERLREVDSPALFDGVFSNFSGLNCVRDLADVARSLGEKVAPMAPVLLCLSSRFCLWEIAWHAAHGNFRKAVRRCGGKTIASVGSFAVPVRYPTVRQMRRLFSPAFVLRSWWGVGVAVPPSYLEPWGREHPEAIARLEKIDHRISAWPGFRSVGDHLLFHFERAS